MAVETLTLRTADGCALAARLYQPEVRPGRSGRPERAVLLAAAMGVPQRFYEAYATWLCQQGVAVLSFDWRGTGESAPRSLKGFVASITDWAEQDLPAAVDVLVQRFAGLPMSYIGHSLGGQLYGWLGDRTRHFEQVLTVASGNGYWRLNAPGTRARAPVLWWLLVPVFTPLFGHFPGKRLGAVGDLPAGAIWQWRRWCLHPDYLGAEGPALRARYAAVRTPITALLLPDDELVSPQGIRQLYGLYAGARVAIQEVHAKDWGRDRIGHFGAFKPASQGQGPDPLWAQTLNWLAPVSTCPLMET